MGEEQVLACKMWKGVVIQDRKHNSVPNDGYANSQGEIIEPEEKSIS